jgi:hypothetical protein
MKKVTKNVLYGLNKAQYRCITSAQKEVYANSQKKGSASSSRATWQEICIVPCSLGKENFLTR